MDEQIVLDLTPDPDFTFETFIETEDSQPVLALLKRWPDWPAPILCLVGPEGSGKSHLGNAWAAHVGASVLRADHATPPSRIAADRPVFMDDADACSETHLFTWMNLALNGRIAGLLIATRKAPAQWYVGLKDLASRLKNVPTATLEEPGDEVLIPVLRKIYSDRGRRVSDELIEYLLKYQDRSIGSMRSLAHELDASAAASKRDLTKAFAAKYLKTREQHDLI